MATLSDTMAALAFIRAPLVQSEVSLHQLVLKALADKGICVQHEALLSQGCRIDLLAGDIGIEIKRGRPNKQALLKQLERYTASPTIRALIVVSERSVRLPETIHDKPVVNLSLNRLWGVAAAKGKAVPQSIPEVPPVQPQEAAIHQNPQAEGPAFLLPPYLQPMQQSGHIYGTLSYNARRKAWVIQGEPCVTEMAKRLFPGSDRSRRGSATFTANRRTAGDLNWLMQRYPLSVAAKDMDRWTAQLEEARAHYLRTQLINGPLEDVALDDSRFSGALRVFQQAGLNWLYHTPRALLADEMGLGKTVQALAALAALRQFPVLLVVPPHLVRNWQSEIARFLRIDGRAPDVHTIKGLTPYSLPKADIYLMHYLLLRGWKETLPALSFRIVVFDEIQELRHNGTEKYSAASLVAESAERVVGLSGTPIYNHGGEIWNVVNILDFHFLGDWESFTREWCYGYGNAIVAKPDLLGDHLRREGIMLRRTKQEVLPELPDKRRFVQEIDTDSALYRTMMQPVLKDLAKWYEDQQLTPSERALLEGNISQGERQATGLAKAPYAAQFVRALIDAGERVLLFAHHHAVMDLYRKELRTLSPVFITGRETGAQKEKSVERFMQGRTDLCCVSLRAASGLNLQRATCVVFGELDWSPAVHSQAEDRAHRIGQKDSLLCYYLVSPEGSDADIQDALGLKVSQFMGLMGEKPSAADENCMDTHFARRHVERLLTRWLASSPAV